MFSARAYGRQKAAIANARPLDFLLVTGGQSVRPLARAFERSATTMTAEAAAAASTTLNALPVSRNALGALAARSKVRPQRVDGRQDGGDEVDGKSGGDGSGGDKEATNMQVQQISKIVSNIFRPKYVCLQRARLFTTGLVTACGGSIHFGYQISLINPLASVLQTFLQRALER